MPNTFFISDTHFGHANIIKLCNRPFDSIEAMDDYLITHWNAKVKPSDTVYILGDFAYKAANPKGYAQKLNGTKILIRGNHDGKSLKDPDFVKSFDAIYDFLETVIDKRRIVMCHYPICEWPGYFRGAYHIFGHIHNIVENPAYQFMKTQLAAFNAGADILYFEPATFEELVRYNKQFHELHP